jgi:hypothetical protein
MPGPQPALLRMTTITRLDRACENRRGRALLAVEYPGHARETQSFLPGDFRDRAFGRQVAVHHDEVAVFLDGVGERANDVLARRIVRDVAKIFRQRPSSDGQALSVQQSCV